MTCSNSVLITYNHGKDKDEEKKAQLKIVYMQNQVTEGSSVEDVLRIL
jgi:hypothetical protein